MKCKKMLAVCLIASILGINVMPLNAHAFWWNKTIKTQITENKLDYVNVNWWNFYNDDILNSYIIKAVENNQDMKVATLKVEEYHQLVKLQFSKELPSVQGGVSPAIYKLPEFTNTASLVSFPLLVNYEADIFLKNRDKTKSAKKAYEMSKFQERATYIAISAAVGSTYFNIVKLDKLIELQKEIISVRKEIYKLMLKRNKQGMTSTADTVRANKSYIMATTDLIELEKTRNILLNKLAVLVGESPDNAGCLKRTTYAKLTFNGKIPCEIPSEIITQRPDYLYAEKQVEKAKIDVKIAKKEFLPSTNILGLFAYNSFSANNSLNWPNAIALLGGSSMFPLFTGGANTANLRIKKSQYEQVLQNYYKTNLTAIQEVNDSLCSTKLDTEKYQKNVKTLTMEKADFQYNQKRYNKGVISRLDLIQNKENLLVIDKMVVSSKTDRYVDYISLYKAVGGKL